jgi:uncharacterized phage protein gp47/JayE
MSLTIPSQKSVIERIKATVRAHIPGADSWVFPNVLWIMATTVGGALWEIFARVRWFSDQAMPDTATDAILDRWAGSTLDIPRLAPTSATGLVTFTGVAGTSIALGLLVNRADGAQYQVSVGGLIGAAGTVSLPVVSVVPGLAQNTSPGALLTLSALDANITDLVVGAAGIGGGADLESDEDLRLRVLAQMRARNRYGALRDYEDWASEVPGVTRSWASASGVSVTVFFAMDYAYPSAYGIPLASDAAVVQAYLMDPARKPVGSTVTAGILIPDALAVTISSVPTNLTGYTTIRAQAETEINAYIRATAKPGSGFIDSQIRRVIDAVPDMPDAATPSVPTGTGTPGRIFTHCVITWI